MTAPTLTQRERELLRSLARGSGDKGAARELGLSVNTVKTYGKVLRAKFGAGNAAQLVAAAARAGVL